MINEFNSLKISFEEMEKQGVVNLDSSLPILQKIAKKIKDDRTSFTKKIKSPTQIFEKFYPSFISSIVLESITNRLKLSKINKDNPKIALDSLAVLPNIEETIYGINSSNEEDLFDIAFKLQTKAAEHNLFNPKFSNINNVRNILGEIIQEIDLSE